MIASLDRVRVTWEGSGTSSPISLGSAINPTYFAPTSALNGRTVSYLIENKSDGIFEVELGRGVYTHSGSTVARTQVVASTNGGIGGSLVNFSAGGIKHVSLALLVSDLGDLSALNTAWRSFAPNNVGLTIDDTSGADILVTYGGTLTADRTVSIDSDMLPASGRGRMVLVLHEAAGGFSVAVDDQNDQEIAAIEIGWSTLVKAELSGASLAQRSPISAGALAALDAIASEHVVAEVITGQTATTDASDSDVIILVDATDGLIKKQTRGNFLTGISGGGGGIQAPIIISGTTHTFDPDNHGKLHIVDNTNQACAITVPDSSAAGTLWRVRSRTTNTITIQRQTSGTVDGGTSRTATGLGQDFKVEVESNAGSAPVTVTEGETNAATTATAAHDHNSQALTNVGTMTLVGALTMGTGGSISDAGPISASGALTKATHGGRAVLTTGNVTIPNAAGDVGMGGIIIAGGAHTISFNSTTSAALATSDVVTYYVAGTTLLIRHLATWASRLTLS